MVTRVGILDYNKEISDNILNLLECNSNYTVAFFSSTGRECLYYLEQNDFLIDILLLDCNLYDSEFNELLRIIRRKYLHVKVIFLTFQSDYHHFYLAMNSGINGYILQDHFISEYKYATEIIREGIIYVDPSLLQNYNYYIEERRKDGISFTKREKQILSYLSCGLINKEIAIKLNITEDTVKSHMRIIYKKIEVNDRTQAALYAIKHNYTLDI
ncbi:MAG: response regulator transcription factor [Lachnospiraceae bacterium]|nr:response regulator transcription factor [Lachnospiraceae bacterium]